MPERESASLTRYVDRDNGQAGLLIGIPSSAVAVAAGRTYYRRFVPSRDMVLVGQSHNLTVAAGVDDSCDGGIYSVAGIKQTSSGATLGKLIAPLGRKVLTYTTPYRVLAGNVYLVALGIITPLGGSAATVTSGPFIEANAGSFFGTAFPQIEMGTELAYPLPTTMTPLYGAASGIAGYPVMAVLE